MESHSYDLILMDCQMPEMDGYEATHAIRQKTGTAFQTIPILAMTANAVKGDRERCLEAGMNDYITKPIKLRDLSVAIKRWIEPPTTESVAEEKTEMTSATVIDPEALNNIKILAETAGSDFLNELIDIFLSTTPPRLEVMRKACESAVGRPSRMLTACGVRPGIWVLCVCRPCAERSKDKVPRTEQGDYGKIFTAVDS